MSSRRHLRRDSPALREYSQGYPSVSGVPVLNPCAYGLGSSLLREIRYLRQCGPHPNVVQIYGSFRAYSWHSLLCAAYSVAHQLLFQRVPRQLTCIVATRHNRRVRPRLLGAGTRKIHAETHEGGPKRACYFGGGGSPEPTFFRSRPAHWLSVGVAHAGESGTAAAAHPAHIQLIMPCRDLPCPRITVPMP